MRKILSSLIAILVVTNLEAQQRTPKLVVCITVDQLRGDYIEYFYNTFGERGFKRLLNEGLVYNNIRFEFSDIDQAVDFYSKLFQAEPAKRRDGYANFAVDSPPLKLVLIENPAAKAPVVTHGLPDENHYTTAYDLYLIFHAAIQDERFMEVISMESYTADITGSDGTVRQDNWPASNFYSSGQVQAPDGVHVFGGKTGTTSLAGNCVILYVEDADNNPYISVIMGAESRNILYEDMNRLFSAGINAAPAS